MLGGRMSPGVLGTCATLLALVQAGPLLRFPRESEDYPNSDFSNYTANEVCFSDQKVFQRGEEVPNAGPCEECRCEPPSIVCQMLKCPVNNNGCRTIQRPNHCCPDYNCECDYNGQLYNDGERIDLPEDPCQVCYCKGGDVMCTSITCYQRDDCEPKHVPGQCCPKFEDCPIRDMEASNTEDKNVQTRSPNKTININPKKEMQPWLLTKSVPQTSSSLAIPKFGETTTDSGNSIIVSDWLVERKTTEDSNIKEAEDPDLSTHKEFVTTVQPQKLTQSTDKESNLEQNIQAAKPTSVDEVVFTRIDIPKIMQEESYNSLTTAASTEVENGTFFALNLPKIIDNSKVFVENTTSNLTSNSSHNYSEDKSTATIKNDKENINSGTFYDESENQSITTISSTDSTNEILLKQTSTVTKKAPSKVEPTYAIETSTSKPERFEVDVTEYGLNHDENKGSQQTNESTENKTIKTDSESKLDEHLKGSTDLSQGVTVSDETDRSSEEMSLERLFGLHELEDSDTTKQTPTSTENYNSVTSMTLLDEQENAIYTTLPTKLDKLINVDDNSTESSFKNKSMSEMVQTEEIRDDSNIDLASGENNSHFKELFTTTETSDGEQETTTFLTSDLNKAPLQSAKLVYESNEKFEETTYLPETTTEIETSTLLVGTIPKHDESKENEMENLIEGNQEDQTDENTNVYTTTLSNKENSEYMDLANYKSSKYSTAPEFQTNKKIILNEGNDQNNNIQEANSHSYYISKVNPFTDSTSTPGNEETTKNTLSQIEIVLGETNNSNILDKSINSQESKEQDEVVLDLAFEEISSENKEVIQANHPPVLELNSHVPFLQIGGDGNSESSDSEYYQTTTVNSIEAVNNFNKKAIDENKAIIKLIDTSKTSSTVTPSTTDEALSKKKEPSKDKVEEFTIPTIAVVPLTPGDLKMIAEYLISEKIKPVSSKNNSMYSPNQWLKGNLTSEENIASILSAANVSIGLMNETNIGRKVETINKSNQNVRFEKFEKETRYKSNSLLDNKNVVTNKIDYLHDKNSGNQDSLKTTTHSLEETNNGRVMSGHVSTEATHKGLQVATTKPLISSRSDQDFENFQNLNTHGSSSEIIDNVGIQKHKSDSSVENDDHLSKIAAAGTEKSELKVTNEQLTKALEDNKQNESITTKSINKNLENINMGKTEELATREEKINQETVEATQTVLGLSNNSKPSDSSTTNNIDTTTSKTVVNKHEAITS